MSKKFSIANNAAMNLGFLTNRVGRLLICMKGKMGKEDFDLPGHCLGILAEFWTRLPLLIIEVFN